MLTDFSFKNQQIKAYFEGSNVYVPSSELMYIHAHPLVKPNFLDEFEAIVLKTMDIIQKKNIRGAVIEKITNLTIQFGAELPTINQENAPKILGHLRELYIICTSLLKNYNIVYP